MLGLDFQYQTKNLKMCNTMQENCRTWQNQVTPEPLNMISWGCVVQLRPLAKNVSNVTTCRKLANCLADRLLEYGGIRPFVSNNTNLKEADIVIDIRIRTGKNIDDRFSLLYTGNLSLRLALILQDHLWFKCLSTADLISTSRQNLYNLARNGIIPVTIGFPNNRNDLEYYGDRYVNTIAGAVKTFTVLLQRGEGGYAANTTAIYSKDSIYRKLNRWCRLLFDIKCTNNNIDRMHRQTG